MHPTQRAILVNLDGRVVPPTFRELAREIGRSVGGMRHHLEVLAAAGLATYEPRLSRTIRITAQGQRALREEEGEHPHHEQR